MNVANACLAMRWIRAAILSYLLSFLIACWCATSAHSLSWLTPSAWLQFEVVSRKRMRACSKDKFDVFGARIVCILLPNRSSIRYVFSVYPSIDCRTAINMLTRGAIQVYFLCFFWFLSYTYGYNLDISGVPFCKFCCEVSNQSGIRI